MTLKAINIKYMSVDRGSGSDWTEVYNYVVGEPARRAPVTPGDLFSENCRWVWITPNGTLFIDWDQIDALPRRPYWAHDIPRKQIFHDILRLLQTDRIQPEEAAEYMTRLGAPMYLWADMVDGADLRRERRRSVTPEFRELPKVNDPEVYTPGRRRLKKD